jgi:hypothetical protein
VLDIEDGFRVKFGWLTDVIKFRSGREQRISRNDTPRESYNGSALLGGNNPRTMRSKLARYASIGSTFLLGLPHEQLTLSASSTGTTIPVSASALAMVDWAKPGQRVVVARRATNGELEFVNAVVQSKTSNTIVLDVAVGTAGMLGGAIMPAKTVYLEPQQSFARYPTRLESWELDARGAMPLDFAPTLAQLDLAPLTASSAFDNLKVTARQYGLIGNQFMFGMLTGGPPGGAFVEADGEMQFSFQAGVTTIGQLATALVGSSFGKLTGTFNPAATIAAGDAFPLTFLIGAMDSGDVGTGASLVTYNGDGVIRPVWDRRIDNASTNTDGIHAMTQIVDHGGIPYALGTADEADWFRAVALSGGNQLDWQWFKLFMSTVKGRQRKFWLSTWRDDLSYVSKATNTITVKSTDGSDFFAWWPHQREQLQILETNGTITRAKITAAVNNGNGTITLTIGTTLATSSVDIVSWLELCRFEGDDYETTHTASGFDVSLIARVVP